MYNIAFCPMQPCARSVHGAYGVHRGCTRAKIQTYGCFYFTNFIYDFKAYSCPNLRMLLKTNIFNPRVPPLVFDHFRVILSVLSCTFSQVAGVKPEDRDF